MPNPFEIGQNSVYPKRIVTQYFKSHKVNTQVDIYHGLIGVENAQPKRDD